MLLSSRNKFRIAATAALVLGAAVNANAWIITFAGTNSGTLLNVNYTFSDLLATPFSVTFGGGANLTGGEVTFASAGKSVTLDYTSTTTTSGGTVSTSGSWVLAGETGLPDVAVTGTTSSSFDNLLTKGDYEWSFVGTTTPEPAPFAAMGIGVIGLCVSRRRKRA